MKVLPSPPVSFFDGDVLDPRDLTVAWQYAADAFADVAGRRWAKSVLVLPFVRNVATARTQADAAELRSIRFKCPYTCVIERAYLSANLTSGAAIYITCNGTELVRLNDAVASASEDQTDFGGERVVLAAGVEYTLLVSGDFTFSLERCDLVLHLAVDRWASLGWPTWEPTLVTDAAARDANVVTTNNAGLATAAAVLAANRVAPVPLFCVLENFTSATATSLRTFALPRWDSSRAQARLVRLYVWAFMAGTGGGTIRAVLQDAASATLATATANVAGVTQASGDAGALAIDLTEATPGITADGAQDHKIVLANSAAVVCEKAYALAWLSR